jgi:CRISPR-associated protein (TIGR03986 family)
MSEFYLPYQFVPATADVKETTPFEKIEKGETNARHDMWQKDTLSGRIVCRLTLETPTFVGNKQARGEPTTVKPYERDGKRAIPANSLRGMISSIAETLSQSSLRVLNDHYYSVRKPLDLEHTLSAVGLLKTNEKSGKLELIPLTLPSLPIKDNNIFISEKWFTIFKGRPLAECFSAYINNYQTADSFLTKNNFNCYSEADLSEKKMFWVETNLAGNLDSQQLKFNNYNNHLYSKGDKVILGQRLYDPKELMPNEQVHAKNNKIIGVLRILGIDGRREQLPPTKKHELFIPYHPKNKYLTLTIDPQALENFRILAEERLEESRKNRNLSKGIKFPFLPKGYEQYYPEFYNEKNKDKYAQLQTGMLVFFDVDTQSIVTELSLSANWRKPVGKNRDYFKKISPDLLPFNPQRESLTPAELLFGFIEEGKQEKRKSSRALASRVRFSDGLSIKKPKEDGNVMLKILGSPKPPCPSLYFGKGHHIKKIELNPEKVTPDKEKYHPNGRKFYLHHPQKQINAKYWKIDQPDDDLENMRLRCSPIAQQEEFWFHIDFDNVSDKELTLLLISLCPSEEFRHKLGLGKSLGLGSVKVDVMGVFGIDRATRYSSTALEEETRYHWGDQIKQDNIEWYGFYGVEYQERNLENYCFTPDYSLIDNKKARPILNKIGDRSAILSSKYWVHNPLTIQQKPTSDRQTQATEQHKFESETFKWFGENDRPQAISQVLKPIEADKELPTLDSDIQQKKQSNQIKRR